MTDADIDAAIERMNTLYATYFRGFRFQLSGVIREVGGMGDTTGPSKYFNTNFLEEDGKKDEMEAAAVANPTTYAWVTNAINIYINNGSSGGICSFPTADNIIIIGGNSAENGGLQLHEIGHYFYLFHTHGGAEATDTTPGDDGITDTLPDHPTWEFDQLANYHFGKNYSLLTTAQRNQIDDIIFNVMSYHHNDVGAHIRLTELQLDKWADWSNQSRLAVVTGQTRFVSTSGSNSGAGSSTSPYQTVAKGVMVANASGGDIILLRPGAYNETFTGNNTISKSLTIRATRKGPVVIGSTMAASTQTESPTDKEH